MRLTDIQVFSLKIPFRAGFGAAFVSGEQTGSVLLALADDAGHLGYGEGAPRYEPAGETQTGTARALYRAFEQLNGVEIETVEDIAHLLEGCDGLDIRPSARCALELALLDLLGKSLRRPALDLLGEAPIEQVFYSAAIASETPELMTQVAQQVLALRIRQVKLEVGADAARNRQNILLLRELLGDQVEIRADANGAWTLDNAPGHIATLLDAGVSVIEQPLPAGEPAQWPALQACLSPAAQVYVNESVCTLDDARWLAERRAVAGFTLNVSRHGGILPSLDIHWLAREHGLSCQLGCSAGESSILAAGGRVLAALSGDLRACEGSYGLLLLEQDLSPRPLQFGFQGIGPVADVRKRSGLGVQVDLNLVQEFLQPLQVY